MNHIHAWLDALESPMPLSLCNADDTTSLRLATSLRSAIEQSKTPQGGPIEALLYIRIGRMEPAHRNVQEATRGLGAYIHGVLHRMEGDYWNAKYWFRQVSDAGLMQSICEHMQSLAITQGLNKLDWVSPSDFVDACEALAKNNAKQTELVRQATWEWQALWQIANEDRQ